MNQYVTHLKVLLAAFFGLAFVLPAQTAHGQSTVRSQDYFRDVTALAEVLGKAHAIRVVCNGRNDQYWRSYMLRLLELEAPYQGGLRRSMVNGFNAGFSWGSDLHPDCDGSAVNAEKAYAREGRDLSARLVQSNIPGAIPLQDQNR